MPRGNPNAQTKASEKYQKKAGYTVKSFKLKREVVEPFEEACQTAGVSQASIITEFMKEFVKSTEKNEKLDTI